MQSAFDVPQQSKTNNQHARHATEHLTFNMLTLSQDRPSRPLGLRKKTTAPCRKLTCACHGLSEELEVDSDVEEELPVL